MKRIALIALALLLLPAAAAAKGGPATVRLQWLTLPDGMRAGETWTARFALLEDGVRITPEGAKPVLRVASGGHEAFTAATRRPDGSWVARVRFPDAASYEVSVQGFDPRDPYRFIDLGPPVAIGPAAAPGTAPAEDGGGFPWIALNVLWIPLAAWLYARRPQRRGAPA